MYPSVWPDGIAPGVSSGCRMRHVEPPSLETAGMSLADACGNVILSGAENCVTGVLVRIVWAVTEIGAPFADQVVSAGAGIVAGSCGAIVMISPSVGAEGTSAAGQATVVFWLDEVKEPLSPGLAVFAVGAGVPGPAGAQIVKWVIRFTEVEPSLTVPVT